jgi:acyl dehydratase
MTVKALRQEIKRKQTPMTTTITNKTFDEIKLGDTAHIQHSLTKRDILLFAIMSGDVNPAHLDEEYAKGDFFHQIVAHGMWGASLISTVLGTELPGPGTIYVSQSLKFLKPILVGDMITAKVTVVEKQPEKHHVILECVCFNQKDVEVIRGVAEVIAPTEKVKRPKVHVPSVEEIAECLGE